MKIKEILQNIHIIRSFRHRINSLLRRADAKRKRWHHLPYVTHIASLLVRHGY